MLMCIPNVLKFCTLVLKILSGTEIFRSIKGCNSVANLRNLTLYNPNLDLINDNVYTNFGLFGPILLGNFKKEEV